MSDPFSAAASAVGCISLGLQVCQYLVTYCQAYKNYDEDVERIGITAQGLRKPLKVLRDLIEETQATNPEMAADLGEKALGLQSRVDNLKTMLDQFKAAVPGDFAGQLKGHLTKVVYPFHKGALRDILMDLNGMQAVLQTTLSIYSAQRLSRIELIQENILQEVRQIHIGVQSIPKNTMPPPAMLASWCNCYSNFQRSTDRCLTSNVDTLVPESSTSESSHSKTPPTSCQRLRIKQRKELFRKTYRYLSSLFRVVVTVSFSMSTGAGGFSIAPSLTFQAVVKFEGSFASMLYQKLDLPIKAPAFDSENVAHGLRQIMQQGFGEGKVAPSDIFYTFEGSYLSLLDVGPRMHQELIRLLTFDALDLKHTCCIEIDCSPEGVLLSLHGIKGRDEEELVAIREENQQGIEMLEELVPMFEAKLNELGIAIWDFLGGYWHAYMTEYISELNSYDNGHDSASRDLGESLQDEDN
ncbi:hypothetical protein BDV06DRAFT_221644 [Aspergillus oleicola]